MYSLRRTLAVRYSLTMFVALLAIALWACAGARRILHSELASGIRAATQLQLAQLARGQAPAPEPALTTHDAFIAGLNRLVAVRDSTGRIRSTNSPLAATLALDSASFARALHGEEAWHDDRWGAEDVRALYVATPAGSPPDHAVLQVAATLGPIEAAGRKVFLLMLGTVLLGTVATAFGAGWLSASVVQPVHQIAGQADAIAPGAVGQRITVHGDVVELQGLIGVLNRMLTRLDQALLAERRVIRDAGHDLRTPITAMRGEIEVALRRDRAADEYRAALRSVLDEVDHLAAIADSLIILARVEAGELEPQPASIDLRTLADEVTERLRTRSGGRVLTVRGGETLVEADPGLLGLVLTQLVDNAVRHTPDGTRVEVAVDGNASHAVVTVTDDGPGIAAPDLPHLFERFYRGDTARGRGAGAGLGLAIAAAVVRVHRGTIRAEPAPGRGLRIVVELPTES